MYAYCSRPVMEECYCYKLQRVFKVYMAGLCFHSQQKELDVKSIVCAFTFR